MTPVRKAVITAAGKGTRQYPATNAVKKELFPLVDRDGITKPTLQIIIEEALAAGVEEICLVVQPGDEPKFRQHFQGLSDEMLPFFKGKEWALAQSQRLVDIGRRLHFVTQEVQEGYGHAVFCSRNWVGDEPFLLLLGDHVYISKTETRCTRQLVEIFLRYQKSMNALQQTPEDQLFLFGTATGKKLGDHPATYDLTLIKEKPDVHFARQRLHTEGLPEGVYLCHFGMHVFTPGIFDAIEYHIKNDIREKGEIQLTNAQELLRQWEGTIGVEIDGERHDMGTPLGYIETQLALAWHSGYQEGVRAILERLP